MTKASVKKTAKKTANVAGATLSLAWTGFVLCVYAEVFKAKLNKLANEITA